MTFFCSQRQSILLYRVLIVSLIASSLNIGIVSFSKVSKILAQNKTAISLVNQKINSFPESFKPIALVGLEVVQNYGVSLADKQWPHARGINNTAWYFRWLLANISILLLLLFKKNSFTRKMDSFLSTSFSHPNKIVNLTNLMASLIILFTFFTWIFRLHWGFWMMGIWGWNMGLKESKLYTIPQEFKLNMPAMTAHESTYKVFPEKCQNLFHEDLLIQAIDPSKITTRFNNHKNSQGPFYITTNVKAIGSVNDSNSPVLISDGAYGFVFPRVVLNNLNVDKSLLDVSLFKLLKYRIGNYNKYQGSFLLPSVIAYPVHNPHNKEFVPIPRHSNFDLYGKASVTYTIAPKSSQNRIASVYSWEVVSCKSFDTSSL